MRTMIRLLPIVAAKKMMLAMRCVMYVSLLLRVAVRRTDATLGSDGEFL